MKRRNRNLILFLSLFSTCMLSAQINLVPCGDFECVVGSVNTECNTNSFQAIPSSWSELGACPSRAPNIFSADYPASCTLSVPTNEFGTQYPLGGLTANRNFVGMQSHLICGEGIKIQLTKPLKEGFQYYLRFNAVKKSANDPVIEFRLGSDDIYEHGNCPSCSQDFFSVTTEGGPNNDQWGSYVISFIPDRCDLEWIFLKLHDQIQGAKMFIDNITINDDCAEEHVCSPYLGDLDGVYCNNIHNNTAPLTFYNLGNVKHMELIIFTPILHIPIRTINIDYPNDIVSWDGKDNSGNYVANMNNYSYVAFFSNDCQCRTIEDDFDKTIDFHIINATAGFYLAANAQTFYHLENVEDFFLRIFDENFNLVRNLYINYPQPTISWDGLNGSGAPVIPGAYHYELSLRNSCEEITFYGDFYQIEVVDEQLAFLDYSSNPVQISCSFSFFYNEYASPPPPCCAQVSDLIIINKNIAGVKDFKLNHDIRVSGTTTIETGSDIYFQAGHEISFRDEFSVKPGAEFAAVILPCTGRYGNPNASTDNDIHLPDGKSAFSKITAIDSLNQGIGSVTVFPNPTSDGSVVVSIINSRFNQIELFNCFGQRIYAQIRKSDDPQKVILEGIDKGVYFLRVLLDNGDYESKQIIVL